MVSAGQGACGLVTVAVLVISILLFILPHHDHESFKPEDYKNYIDVDDEGAYKKIYHLTEETQLEWEEALRYAPISRIVAEGYTGLATKYLVVFETGHLAIAKLVEPFQLFEQEWDTISYQDNSRYEPQGLGYARSGRKYQAWTEVAAYLASRIAFPVARKPPATIRTVSSKKLYGCQGCFSWTDRFKYWLPEHDVHISVHAYMNKLKISPPSTRMMEYMTHTPTVLRHFQMKHPHEDYENAMLVSDVIIFDYLLDDHDRKRGHNWMLDGDAKLLLWDSGLVFQHGPAGKSSCSSLFCGPDGWQEHGKDVYNLKHCAKLCRFRQATVTRLRELSPESNVGKPHLTLGSRMRQQIEALGEPIFEWNAYYQLNRRFPKIKFAVADFYTGLDLKLTRLLEHVDQCIQTHGIENVLMNEDDLDTLPLSDLDEKRSVSEEE